MTTGTNQYANSPVYGAPKTKPTGATFRSDAPIEYNNKPKGNETAKEIAPINSGK